jgi:hypothetical protein
MGVVYVINHVLLELVVIWNVQHTVNVMTMENVHVISMELTQAIDVILPPSGGTPQVALTPLQSGVPAQSAFSHADPVQ